MLLESLIIWDAWWHKWRGKANMFLCFTKVGEFEQKASRGLVALPKDFGYGASPTDARAMRDAIYKKFLECCPTKGCLTAFYLDTTDEEHVKVLWQSAHNVAAGAVKPVEGLLVPAAYT